MLDERWTSKQREGLQEWRRRMFAKHKLSPYESEMSLDLQSLELEVLEWIFANQHREHCPKKVVHITFD